MADTEIRVKLKGHDEFIRMISKIAFDCARDAIDEAERIFNDKLQRMVEDEADEDNQ